MQHWCSATAIATSLESKLHAAGLSELKQVDSQSNDPSQCLLIYSAPHEILMNWRARLSSSAKGIELHTIFQKTKQLGQNCQNYCAEWRLNEMDTTLITRIKQGGYPRLASNTSPPCARPLAGILTLRIIKEYPEILEIYLDLELQSLLFGLEPDSNYTQRLENCSPVDLALQDWWYQNREQEGSLEETTETLAQLHQCQQDYDQLVRQQEKLRAMMNEQNQLNREALAKLAKAK